MKASSSDAPPDEAFEKALKAAGEGSKVYKELKQSNAGDVKAVRKYLANGGDVNKLGGRLQGEFGIRRRI